MFSIQHSGSVMGRKGTPFPYLHFIAKHSPTSDCYNTIGKVTQPLSGAQT